MCRRRLISPSTKSVPWWTRRRTSVTCPSLLMLITVNQLSPTRSSQRPVSLPELKLARHASPTLERTNKSVALPSSRPLSPSISCLRTRISCSSPIQISVTRMRKVSWSTWLTHLDTLTFRLRLQQHSASLTVHLSLLIAYQVSFYYQLWCEMYFY